jgi:hypothetical protein
MRSLTQFTSALVVAVGSTAAATAADFTFNVPVTLTNIPAAFALHVWCGIYTKAPLGQQPTLVGQAMAPVTLVTGGNFSGTVTVAVNANATTPPATVNSYSCNISLDAKNTSGVPFQTDFQIIPEWKGATGQTITVTPALPNPGSGWSGVSGSVP